jgi:hypothetical protein
VLEAEPVVPAAAVRNLPVCPVPRDSEKRTLKASCCAARAVGEYLG